jgi:peptidoglycan-associated lipoprotein
MLLLKEEIAMRNRSKISTVVSYALILLVSMFALWGCLKSSEVTAVPEEQPAATVAPEQSEAAKAEAMAQANAEKERADAAAAAAAAAAAEAKAREEAAASERAAAAAEAGLKPIYFDFDRSFIRDDARPVMKANAEWLKANPKVKVKIEGNCDERGTIEYNQALGQRRAAAAKKYLTDLGISSSRISLISYGKEKPVCSEQTEECWQNNRRDELVATTP